MNYTNFLGRTETENSIKSILREFHTLDKSLKRNIYVQGPSSVGKTTFVNKILQEMNYDVIKYDAGETKNNHTIELIIKNNLSNQSIISAFTKEKRRLAIVIDETDGLCCSDKAGLSTLIKLVRPKKTKKQKLEPYNTNPIIFIGNYHVDKNITDLIHVCHTFDLHPPTNSQMSVIVRELFPTITQTVPNACEEIVHYVCGDLAKLSLTHEYYRDNETQLLEDINTILIKKTQNIDRNKKIQYLFHNDVPLKLHTQFVNETERTTLGLLWHENVIDLFKTHNAPVNVVKETEKKTQKKTSKAISKATSKKTPLNKSQVVESFSPLEQLQNHQLVNMSVNIQPNSAIRFLPMYVRILDNICFSDYIDRITFQKQVWQLNELSSLIKTFKNNHIIHTEFLREEPQEVPISNIRFTKILTKYSSEYNNFVFIRNICQTLGLDKKDLFSLLSKYPSNQKQLMNLFETNEFELTTFNRLLKYYNVCSTGNLSGVETEPEEIITDIDMVGINLDGYCAEV